VTVGDDTLKQELKVLNTATKNFQFTGALHTYFRVASIDRCKFTSLRWM
jgi:D-hexose-6-phosphate mutarotase